MLSQLNRWLGRWDLRVQLTSGAWSWGLWYPPPETAWAYLYRWFLNVGPLEIYRFSRRWRDP